jgi:hypothetical protein
MSLSLLRLLGRITLSGPLVSAFGVAENFLHPAQIAFARLAAHAA